MQSTPINGHKYLRRRPIKITYHKDLKPHTLEDYVEEAKVQASNILDDNDGKSANILCKIS